MNVEAFNSRTYMISKTDPRRKKLGLTIAKISKYIKLNSRDVVDPRDKIVVFNIFY